MQIKSVISLKVILCAAMIAGTGCSKENSGQNGQLQSQNNRAEIDVQAERIIEVIDAQGQPLQAQILIGDKAGSPFADNFISTNSSGKLSLPEAWNSPQHVTIDVPGYVRVTQLDQEPGPMKIVMRKQNPALNIELSGNTTGYQTKDNDDRADFGLVLSSIKKSDILSFSLDALISPQTDQISVVGYKFDLPSNIALPAQKEKYSFVTVSVNKPNYRSYFSDLGPKTIFLARGHVPFKKMADAGQNKAPVHEMVNDISLTGGQIKQVNLTGAKTSLDLNAATMNFSSKISYRAPQFESNQVVLAVAAAELPEGFLPSDVKSLRSGESMNMNSFTEYGSQMRFLSVLKNKNEFDAKAPGADRFSAALQNANQSMSPTMLPLLADPEVVNPQVFQFSPPSAGNLMPLASTILISSVSARAEDDELSTQATTASTPNWEIRSRGWVSKVALPQFPGKTFLAQGKVEMSFLASSGQIQAQSWDEIIQATTHVTHSSKQY